MFSLEDWKVEHIQIYFEKKSHEYSSTYIVIFYEACFFKFFILSLEDFHLVVRQHNSFHWSFALVKEHLFSNRPIITIDKVDVRNLEQDRTFVSKNISFNTATFLPRSQPEAYPFLICVQ